MRWNTELFHQHLKTRKFGREFQYFEVIDSTNVWLANQTALYSMSGGIVLTDHQTKGQGRQARRWHDCPECSMLFSLLIRVRSLSSSLGIINLIPSIAVAEAIRDYLDDSIPVKLKWPNDVIINGKKIAGILGKHLRSGLSSQIIIGVGINVTSIDSSLSEATQLCAISLEEVSNTPVSREEFLASILLRWEEWQDQYDEGRYLSIIEKWMSFGPDIGSRITFHYAKEIFSGIYHGLDNNGYILILDEHGNMRTLSSGDVIA